MGNKDFVAPLGSSEKILADGRFLVHGETVSLEDDEQKDDHNARLIEEGQLLEVGKTKTKKSGGE
jgi:hypothetical protein